MPIYEYECEKCGEKFEAFQRPNEEDELLKCPKCHSAKAKRVLSAFNKGHADNSCAPRRSG